MALSIGAGSWGCTFLPPAADRRHDVIQRANLLLDLLRKVLGLLHVRHVGDLDLEAVQVATHHGVFEALCAFLGPHGRHHGSTCTLVAVGNVLDLQGGSRCRMNCAHPSAVSPG